MLLITQPAGKTYRLKIQFLADWPKAAPVVQMLSVCYHAEVDSDSLNEGQLRENFYNRLQERAQRWEHVICCR